MGGALFGVPEFFYRDAIYLQNGLDEYPFGLCVGYCVDGIIRIIGVGFSLADTRCGNDIYVYGVDCQSGRCSERSY